MSAKKVFNLLENVPYLLAVKGSLYTSIVYVEEEPTPLKFDSTILRFWANTGNRSSPVSLDVHQ